MRTEAPSLGWITPGHPEPLWWASLPDSRQNLRSQPYPSEPMEQPGAGGSERAKEGSGRRRPAAL